MTRQITSDVTNQAMADRGPVRCTACGSTMAADQRYCLECGKRKGDPRTEFASYLNGAGELPETTVPAVNGSGPTAPAATEPAPDNRPEREVTPLMAAAGLAGLAVILLLGVLIGRLGETGSSAPIVAATGVPAASAPTTSTATSVEVAFAPDWPEGQEGFTIELATLSKDSADGAAVEATKADLTAQGAPEVGALDSDQFGSLPAGNYVFYSGVYDSKADAEAALEPLQASFPDAQVIEVAADAGGGGGGGGGGEAAPKISSAPLLSDAGANKDPDAIVKADEEELADANSASAEEYQELQKKLPTNIATEGKLPPKDNKKPGAGGPGAVEIG